MLVLTRKLQERILIGNDVVITILQVRGQAVRVGIEAPRNVRVLRAELTQHDEQSATNNIEASGTASGDRNDNRANQTVTIQLNNQLPGARVEVKSNKSTRQPLAGRLQARRNPNTASSPMIHQPELSAAALLATVGANH